MKLSKYGLKEWGGSGLVALLLIGFGYWLASCFNLVAGYFIITISTLLWLAIAAFFRVPRRDIPSNEELILSPADGVVTDIESVSDHGIELFEEQELIRIGIFLSVLNVHVNRAPTDFSVEYKNYKPGKFLDARSSDCKKVNESLVIAGTASTAGIKFPMAVRQISGAIARRIVCDVEPGENLLKGSIYGMIKFGSRTEIYLPKDRWIKLDTQVGNKVYSGISIIARLVKE